MAVLLYAIRCLEEGDQPALRSMNFGPKEVTALRDINLADLYRAGSLKAHCLNIRLDRSVYWPMLKYLRREREIEAIQRDLIQADAPLEMMRSLFGVGAREYTRLRRLLASDPAIGRPPELDEGMSNTLWQTWSKRTKEDPTASMTAEHYLALSEDTGAPMRAIWNLTQRWAEYGDLSRDGVTMVSEGHASGQERDSR